MNNNVEVLLLYCDHVHGYVLWARPIINIFMNKYLGSYVESNEWILNQISLVSSIAGNQVINIPITADCILRYLYPWKFPSFSFFFLKFSWASLLSHFRSLNLWWPIICLSLMRMICYCCWIHPTCVCWQCSYFHLVIWTSTLIFRSPSCSFNRRVMK